MNNNMSNSSNMLGDKEALSDFLATQKMISSTYNTFAGECVNTQLRDEFLNILKEEHCIQSEIFSEMQSRGWYQVQPADANEVTKARQKFSVSQ